MLITLRKTLKIVGAILVTSLLIANRTHARENSPERAAYSPLQTADTVDTQVFLTETSVSPLPSQTIPSNSNLVEQTSANEIAETPSAISDTTNILEQVNLYSNDINTDALDRVTNVSQLRDVSPGDWAYEALRSLVERYGCIAGYPDGTFRGNRAMTRYEFAAGLNSCLQQIEKLIADSTSNLASREDVETLQRLVQEFTTELATIGARVDKLEGRVAFLEDHQFSTTTKLSSEIIFATAQVFGEENAATGNDLNEQTTFSYRVRQSFLSSFTGKDRLRIRLQSGNVASNRGGSNITNLNFGSNTNNDFRLNKLEYRFPIGDNTRVWLATHNMNLDDVADTLAPFTNEYATGSVSQFGGYAPIYWTSSGAGAAISHNFSNKLNLVAYYSAGNANNPSDGKSLFNGQYVAATQLTFKPSDNAAIGLVYANSYFPGADTGYVSGGAGSALADNPFQGNATSTDSLVVLGTWRIIPALNLEGWGMYTRAEARGGSRDGDTADIWNWKLSFAFPDLFNKGSVGVLTVGNPPKAYNVEGGREDNETSWFFEAFYKYQFNEYVSLTPAVFVITNPEDNRDSLWVGVLRLSFTF
ncbi:MAG: iron uptake porin [Coleofasciculaceae cyanobacterium]